MTNLSPDSRVVDARYGRIFYFPDDDPIGKSLAMYGEWAEAEIQFLSALIGLGSIVVDVGANLGTHTLAFSRRVGPRGCIRAFEPQRAVFELLEKSLAANGCANVVANCAGVGRMAGEMLVPAVDYTGHVNVGGVTLVRLDSPCPTGDKVEQLTPIVALDDLALEACHLVKVDAEGMEEDVLSGMARTIWRLRPVVHLECNTVDDGAAILGAVEWSDYRFLLLRTAVYNPANHHANTDNFFGPTHESSLLCVPGELIGLVPARSPLVDVFPVTNLQELAEYVLATPRHGDATKFDRDPMRLREEFTAASARNRGLADRVTELEGELAAVAARVTELKDELAAAVTRVAELTGELAAAAGEAETRAENIKRLEFRCASLAEQLARAERGRGLADRVSELERELAGRESQLAALHTSTSWRVTAPLRLMSTALRGGRLATARSGR